VNRDEAAPLIRRDFPEFEGALPAVGADCAWTDAGVVDEDIDAAKFAARCSGDRVGCGIVGQIGRDRQQFGRLPLFTRACREHLQRFTIAINAGNPDPLRQQSPRHYSANATCGTGHNGHSLDFGHLRASSHISRASGRAPTH